MKTRTDCTWVLIFVCFAFMALTFTYRHNQTELGVMRWA